MLCTVKTETEEAQSSPSPVEQQQPPVPDFTTSWLAHFGELKVKV